MSGRASVGCGDAACHGVLPADAVTPLLEGLPEAYTPGETYVLSISATGAREPLPLAANQGGFALGATDGALAPAPGDETVGIGEDGNATHTAEGAARRAWTVVWAAPPPTAGAVTFHLAVNGVNGNGAPDLLDEWNTVEVTIREGSLPEPPAASRPDTESTSGEAGSTAGTPLPGIAASLAALALTAIRLRGRRD